MSSSLSALSLVLFQKIIVSMFEKLYIISLKSATLLYIVSDRCIVILYCMFLF